MNDTLRVTSELVLAHPSKDTQQICMRTHNAFLPPAIIMVTQVTTLASQWGMGFDGYVTEMEYTDTLFTEHTYHCLN